MVNNITKEQKICVSCKKKYTPNSNSQKMCEGCKTSECQFCKKSFSIANLKLGTYKGKYCSLHCYHKDRWGNGSGTCNTCAKKLKEKQAKYCSKKCQQEFWNKQGYHLGAKQRYRKRKIALIEKLGGQCKHCGSRDIRVLDVNHIDRKQKKRPLKRAYNWTRRLKEWEQNTKNLELLCANCHRIHTWKQMGYGVGLDPEYFEIAKKRIEQTSLPTSDSDSVA